MLEASIRDFHIATRGAVSIFFFNKMKFIGRNNMSKPWPADMKCYINVGDSTMKKLIHVYCTVYRLIHYFFKLHLILFNRRKNSRWYFFFYFLNVLYKLTRKYKWRFKTTTGTWLKIQISATCWNLPVIFKMQLVWFLVLFHLVFNNNLMVFTKNVFKGSGSKNVGKQVNELK